MGVRIYQPMPLEASSVVTLDEEAAHHVAKVLRLKCGQRLQLFNGNGNEYTASIQRIEKKRVELWIEEAISVDRESPLKLHLFQSISKGERMDFVMQKAVELGASELTPVLSERCVVRLNAERLEKKRKHWQKIAYSACEQSGRTQLPKVHSPRSFQEVIREQTGAQKYILLPEAKQSIASLELKAASVSIMIGPEGGFSPQEAMLATQSNFSAIHIGPRVLRTETAALAALSVFQALGGDF